MIQAPDVFHFIPFHLLQILHWVCGFIVLAEALNKLERCAPLAHGLTVRQRAVAWLKVLAWLSLAVGGAGALITPLLNLQAPTLQDVAVIFGMSVLIVRSRLKETNP